MITGETYITANELIADHTRKLGDPDLVKAISNLRELLMWVPSIKGLTMSRESMRGRTAYHEAGHAVMAYLQ
jgi:hypothetical protein